jgi:hypothetical protein
MADLRVVSLDNVLYVTSRDRAKELEAEKAERAAKERKAEQPPAAKAPEGK